MKRPDADVVKALATIARQQPAVLTWLGRWKQHEYDTLPYVSQNMAVAQGRCQVLSELYKLISDAPELAAQPNREASGTF